MKCTIIVAKGNNGVIGNDNKLPWHLPKDLKNFKYMTLGKTVVMGRNTFKSIGKPLPGRTNVVLSRTVKSIPGVTIFDDISKMIMHLHSIGTKEFVIIGGADLFKIAMNAMHPGDEMIITEVNASPEGDTFFPPIKEENWEVTRTHPYFDGNVMCSVATYTRNYNNLESINDDRFNYE